MSHLIKTHAGLIGYYEGYMKGILSHLKRREEPNAEDKFLIEMLETALASGNQIWEDIKNESYEKNY